MEKQEKQPKVLVSNLGLMRTQFNCLGEREQFSLSARGIHAVALVFIVSSIVAMLQFVMLGHYANAIHQLMVTFIFSIIYYLSRFKKQFSVTRKLTAISFFIGYAVLWYMNHHSSFSPYLVYVGLIVFAVILWPKKIAYIIASVLTIETIVILYLHNSDYFLIKSLGEVKPDIKTISEVLLVAASLTFFLVKVMEDYTFEKERAESQSLELKEVNHKLESVNRHLAHLTTIDGLTCLFNRRHFDEYLYNELCRSLRNGTELTLAMLDIDNFKTYNDMYGHTTGDEILRAISDVLIATIKRNTDMVARYGGEEFAIVMPETAMEGAIVLMKNIAQRISQEPDLNKYFHSVSVSIGLAANRGVDCNMQQMIRRADKALYEAKHAGKNCIRIFTLD